MLRKLSTPAKIQDFLNTLPFNFCANGDTCFSPRMVLKKRTAHCMEGAMFAAAALRLQGHDPLVVDLEAAAHDDAHVIAVFREGRHWGAISKTNHAVLRYRDPVYRSIRELVMSYFHEYTDTNGRKTLRSYTRPVNLARFDRFSWMTSEEDVWSIPEYLADATHQPITDRRTAAGLRVLDSFERSVLDRVEWKKRKK